MKVAVIHDWINGMRGGEAVLEAILELFPDAVVYTLIYVRGSASPAIEKHQIKVSPLQYWPGGVSRYRYYLPLFPFFIRSWSEQEFSQYDLIVSSSHCVAKGIRKPKSVPHLSYVHAPMRYVWDRFDDYFGKDRAGFGVRALARMIRPYLRWWDRASSSEEQVDQLVANSQFIAAQIANHYGREARVVHPFVDSQDFRLPRESQDFYLMVGAFAPNKRVDLAIEACNRLKLKLKIVGSGQEEERLRAIAGPTIEFLGNRSRREIAELFSHCRAFIFPGVEDFGITPLESMAAGAPVIAYREGGALETVTEKTGIFFYPQTVEALSGILMRVESQEMGWQESDLRSRASSFSRVRFQTELRQAIDEMLKSRSRK